jgi:hypothetical protein
MAMNRPGTIASNPEGTWLAKVGNHVLHRVDYYQWLCPTRKESRNHVPS